MMCSHEELEIKVFVVFAHFHTSLKLLYTTQKNCAAIGFIRVASVDFE